MTATIKMKRMIRNNSLLRAAAGWLALANLPEMKPANLARFFRDFGCAEDIFSAAGQSVLLGATGCQIDSGRLAKERDKLMCELEEFDAQGLRAIPIESPDYPKALLDLRVPPAVIFVSGQITPADSRAIALVGTRTPSLPGRELARELGGRAAAAGFCVVSGLARGIDTEAHQGALAAGGRTLAMLGNGLLNIYPPENQLLANRIMRKGALVSELWPQAQVARTALLARNRLQAALAKAVVVVQANLGCGSLTTARYAISCRRPLFAISWPAEPFATGVARLRELGARIISPRDLDEILRAAEADASGTLFAD